MEIVKITFTEEEWEEWRKFEEFMKNYDDGQKHLFYGNEIAAAAETLIQQKLQEN